MHDRESLSHTLALYLDRDHVTADHIALTSQVLEGEILDLHARYMARRSAIRDAWPKSSAARCAARRRGRLSPSAAGSRRRAGLSEQPHFAGERAVDGTEGPSRGLRAAPSTGSLSALPLWRRPPPAADRAADRGRPVSSSRRRGGNTREPAASTRMRRAVGGDVHGHEAARAAGRSVPRSSSSCSVVSAIGLVAPVALSKVIQAAR